MASLSLGRRRVLPGFAPTLGFTLFYLSLIVLVPLAAVFLKSSGHGWDAFWTAATSPRGAAGGGGGSFLSGSPPHPARPSATSRII